MLDSKVLEGVGVEKVYDLLKKKFDGEIVDDQHEDIDCAFNGYVNERGEMTFDFAIVGCNVTIDDLGIHGSVVI